MPYTHVLDCPEDFDLCDACPLSGGMEGWEAFLNASWKTGEPSRAGHYIVKYQARGKMYRAIEEARVAKNNNKKTVWVNKGKRPKIKEYWDHPIPLFVGV